MRLPAFSALLTGSLLILNVPSSHAAAAADSAQKPVRATTAEGEGEKKEKTFSDLFEGMQFRSIGPFRGGRVTAVTGVRGQPLTAYFGSTGGGVWKTTDGGSNWENVSDKYFKTGSVGAVAVSESDPNVVYAGMGESPVRGNVSFGDGVYRSTDAGMTWTNVGLKDAGQISRVRIHPTNPEIVYVAVQGHIWGPNPTRGVYRTEDGGRTWKRVLYVDEKSGACDLAMDPTNPRVLYAAFWQAIRRPWEFVSGGPGSGLWRSLDGGDTWKKLANGLPDGPLGRIGVAASGARPGLVWASVEAKKGGLYKSEDRGDKWTWVNDDHNIRERAWYYSWVYADPKDPERLYMPNVRLHKSSNGGASFANLDCPHGDNHDFWIDPDNPSHLMLGNDGGCTITYNGGRTWSTQYNQPTAQFYRVITDHRFPYWVFGAQQDNSSLATPSASTNRGIELGDWHPIGGGESGWIAPDPRDPEVEYGGGYGGSITCYDHRLEENREVTPWPQLASGRATRDLKYRFQWNAPIVISRWDSTTIYHASQILLRSRDRGQSWEEMSPDLTRDDKEKEGLSGGPITKDITGVEVFCTIFCLAESRHERGVLWAGSDDGLVHVTRDGGRHWDNVTPRGLPTWIRINSIDASPYEPGGAYVAATMYQFDDNRPYLYKTKDYGRTWTRIVTGIPDGAFTRVVRADPARRGLLYAGTETGLYVSFDDGATWKAFQRNLPATPVTDLEVKGSDLVVATQGRAFWILDDLGPLRAWNDVVAKSDAHLFEPRPSYRTQFGEFPPDEPVRNVGKNPPNGVIVDYWLREKPREKEFVTIDIFSGDSLIRHFTSEKPAPPADLKEKGEQEERQNERDKPLEPKAGLNRFVWDMRIFKPTLVPKAVFNEGDKAPPRVGAGVYRVALAVGAQKFSAPIEVRPHPEGHASAADLKAQFDLLADIRNRLSECHVAVMTCRDVRNQVDDAADRAVRLGRGAGLKEKAKALDEKLLAVESELINPDIKADEDDLNYPPKLDHDFTALAGIVGEADERPTDSSVRYYAILRDQLAVVQARLKSVLDGDLAEFNRSVDATGLPRIVAAPKVER